MPNTQIAPQFGSEQFHATRLQLFNWGTFSDLHDIPIAGEGFLFIGRSGTGKSTVLDAFSALLIPPRWVDFNAAARETERTGRDRNLVTYIRGAWAEQKDDDSGEIMTRYLRTGTTWSSLALTFTNALGQTVVLVQVFWLRGNTNASTEVRRYFLIFERPFDLRELQDFDLDVRKLKQAFPESFARDEFRPYCERFCRLLGIENEMALRLLHKTQSAKNLGDLNTFLRDFMLDRPTTFELADRLVGEFADLNAAHQAVVIAREQVQTLTPAREGHRQLQKLEEDRATLESLRRAIEIYREIRRKGMLEEHIAELKVKAEAMQGEVLRQTQILSNQRSLLRDLEQQHREIGGDRIERWQAEKQNLENQRAERLRKQDQAKHACSKLAWAFPNSPKSFAELAAKARQEIEDWQRQRNTSREQQITLATRVKEAEKEFVSAVREVEALKRQPSNIPAEMLELRHDLAAALAIPETRLPFVGELLEVRQEESSWRGAIERVLHGFALSVLVDERHYGALSSHVNATNLGNRLIYYRTSQPERSQYRPVPSSSLVLKLNVKDNEYAAWLNAELRQRFDYLCADSLQTFRVTERALTREGQIRHNKSRHEKDDRSPVNDRRRWVLGFDNGEKRELFEKQAQGIADEISKLNASIKRLADQETTQASRAIECQTLANLQWHEVDVAAIVARIGTIDEQLREALECNPVLQEISDRLDAQKQTVEDCEKDLLTLKSREGSTGDQITESLNKLKELQEDPRLIPLPSHMQQSLDERYEKLGETVRLSNLDKLTTTVVNTLSDDEKAVADSIHDCKNGIEKRFADFKRVWPLEAGDMDTTMASAPDFLALLTRLETDGLPAHEHRFFDLLQNQSHQNLAALATHLSQARKAILERMELVNESLGQALFNPSTYLHIDVSDRQLPEVKEFKQEIQLALSNAWTDDREVAEARFVTLRRIVDRLGSQDPEKRRWREAVLDVRLHVEFIGREVDENGREVEVYRSGAGKSGGQRQKLATTCLAAALRYQLGGNDHALPIYAPVVLDEAFDKADNEFTELSMKIFVNFGFQMIVATPLKSVMTLEPFIGGACFIDITERRNSSVLLIEYDAARLKLKLPEHAQRIAAGEAS